MAAECNDRCKPFLLDDHHHFEGKGFYCKTCSDYFKIEYLIKGRCGCCRSKVRLKPRYAEMNRRKIARRTEQNNLNIIQPIE